MYLRFIKKVLKVYDELFFLYLLQYIRRSLFVYVTVLPEFFFMEGIAAKNIYRRQIKKAPWKCGPFNPICPLKNHVQNTMPGAFITAVPFQPAKTMSEMWFYCTESPSALVQLKIKMQRLENRRI